MRTVVNIKGWLSIFFAVMVCLTPGMQANGAAQDATAEAAAPPQFAIEAANSETPYWDDIEIEPGAQATLEAVVRNVGTVPVDLKLYMTNAHNGDGGGFRAGAEDEELVGSATWVTLPFETLTLQAGDRATVAFTVDVPEGTEPGQYISGIVVETAAPVGIPGETTFSQNIRSATSVGILVPGDLVYSFEIGEPVAEARRISIPVVNTGNYLVRPAGELVLHDDAGEPIQNIELEMRSIYPGNTANLVLELPDQMPLGDYGVSLTLQDPESGQEANLEQTVLAIEDPFAPPVMEVTVATIEPNAEEIVFADVALTVSNPGSGIASANVVLLVSRDGELVEEFNVATNQVLVTGENQVTSRYIPADGTWAPGTYTFSVSVMESDPDGGAGLELLSQDLDVEIVVP